MLKKVICPECGTKHMVNTEKHKFRPKYCTNCRTIIDNTNHKIRVNSHFQKLKGLRKQATRERFMNRLKAMNFSHREIARRMVKVFKGEEG